MPKPGLSLILIYPSSILMLFFIMFSLILFSVLSYSIKESGIYNLPGIGSKLAIKFIAAKKAIPEPQVCGTTFIPLVEESAVILLPSVKPPLEHKSSCR